MCLTHTGILWQPNITCKSTCLTHTTNKMHRQETNHLAFLTLQCSNLLYQRQGLDNQHLAMQPYPRNTCSMWHHQPFRRIFSVSLSSFPKGVNTAEVPLAKGLRLPKPSGHLEGVPHPEVGGILSCSQGKKTTRISRDAKWQLYRYIRYMHDIWLKKKTHGIERKPWENMKLDSDCWRSHKI